MKRINHLPRFGLIVIFLLFVVGYSLFEARFLIIGPEVRITSHPDGAHTDERVIILEGTAENIAHISLNGRQIFTDTEGQWSEKLALSEGLSIMTVEAEDRFGRETQESISIFLN